MSDKFTNKESLHLTISKSIKKYRTERNMTQAQLAEAIEISHEYLRQIESVKGQKDFSLYTLYKISIVLDISIDKFFKV